MTEDESNDASAEDKRKRITELETSLAALPKLTLEQRVRVFFNLYTSPKYIRLRIHYIYTGLMSLYYGALIAIWGAVLRSILRVTRPVYRPYGVIIPSALILGAGIAASSILDDWTWFPRSGSLLVVIAALMHIYNAKESAEKAKIRLINRLGESISALEQFANEAESPKTFSSIRTAMQVCQSRFVGYDIERVGRTYKRYEIIAAICGTFVSGFGDLLGRLA